MELMDPYDSEAALIAIETVEHLRMVLSTANCPECVGEVNHHTNWCRLGQHLNRTPVDTGD